MTTEKTLVEDVAVTIEDAPTPGLDPADWEEINSGGVDQYWTPEPGQHLHGTLNGHYVGQFGKTYLLLVGNNIIGLPSHTVLNDKLSKCFDGEELIIHYVGERVSEGSKRLYREYKVVRRRAP